MIVFGLVMVLKGPSYGVGTLVHMGPGFLPTSLGAMLIGLGILIAVSGDPTTADEDAPLKRREWRGWACILASPLAFILFGRYFRLIPAAFFCVFVAAMGDRTAGVKNAAALAAVVTLLGVGLFSYLLDIPLPLLAWIGW